ncbi:NADH-quinone oxidoreductase [Vulcanimicrobium alpinum]|uniref:NADH-quinone oxidoreductase n=1 Tax=Vulcanimicrobium alpinum TaxID=3016050 RepID=A0AAN2CAI9_UNVUL|nr:molybdopterin-dependent oxidoreductase [Vulcanimicrobium alpinum]BDE07151.1 NADH-quinone oxidoreductase [Vulcanimicrobium alpinum]
MSATVPQTDLVTVSIDGIDVRVPKGTLLVEAARSIQREIPVYCYHEKLGPAGLCRICLVEIEGMPKLQIACNTVVADGMKVHTTNPKVDDGRRAILEFFLLNHPLDCPICDKGGECDLQDYAMAYGQGASRMIDAKTAKPKAVDLGPTIVLDEERCIVCQRCVRFDQIITREASLRTEDRGAHTIIATASGKPFVSDFTGNVTELCPVGALTSKTYRFRSRPWDNHRTTTTCTQCAVGCQMHVDERGNTLLRTMSVEEDDAISDAWLCDRGRYNIGFVNDERRITQPLLKQDGAWMQIGWDDAIALWAAELKKAGTAAGVIGGGRLLNEEAYLAAFVHRAIGVKNLDHRVGAQTVVHHDSFASHVDLENADTIVTLGRPPSQLAPVFDLRIRKAVAQRGARLISVGDHPANSFVAETRATNAEELRVALGEKPGRVAMIWDGVMLPDGPALTAPLMELADALRYVLPEEPNGRGADAVGMRPVNGGLNTRAMLEAARDGKLGVLAILGANPMLRFPDRALVEAALRATPFVVVTDLFLTETAEFANLVLPVCSAFEKTGTTTDLAGDVLPVTGAVRPPDGVLADGDVLVMLAEALGVALPGVEAMEAAVRDLVRTPPAFAPDAAGPPALAPVPASRLRVIRQAAIFTGGGTLAFDARVAELRTAPRAALHPATAHALGVGDGDELQADAGDGNVVRGLSAVLDPRVPEDAVALVDGIVAAPLNVLGGAGSVKVQKALVPA